MRKKTVKKKEWMIRRKDVDLSRRKGRRSGEEVGQEE